MFSPFGTRSLFNWFATSFPIQDFILCASSKGKVKVINEERIAQTLDSFNPTLFSPLRASIGIISKQAFYSPRNDGNILTAFCALFMETFVYTLEGWTSLMSTKSSLLHSRWEIGVEFSKLV